MTTSFSTAIKAITSSQARQQPVVMITSAVDGPRVCVPDAGELRVIDDRRLRVAVWPSDPTADDLERDASTVLVVTAPSDVHVIRARARRLINAAMVWAHYELTITSARIVGRGTAPFSQDDLLTQWPTSKPAWAPSSVDGTIISALKTLIRR